MFVVEVFDVEVAVELVVEKVSMLDVAVEVDVVELASLEFELELLFVFVFEFEFEFEFELEFESEFVFTFTVSACATPEIGRYAMLGANDPEMIMPKAATFSTPFATLFVDLKNVLNVLGILFI